MSITVCHEMEGISWALVAETLARVGMAHYEPERHQRAFAASAVKVFLFEGRQLVGFGRALSDGAYQAAIYDCAILPEYQGQGHGRRLMEELLAGIGDCNVILYAAIGKEGFYTSMGFRRMKTGLARFRQPDLMRARGFTE